MRKTSMPRLACTAAVSLLAAGIAPATATAQTASLSPELKQELLESLERGNRYLLDQRRESGTFDANPGVSALTVSAILGRPDRKAADQMSQVDDALSHLAGLARPDGGIYERDTPHYITAVALSALVAANRPEYQAVIEAAQAYMVEQVVDEGEGYSASDKFYGGLVPWIFDFFKKSLVIVRPRGPGACAARSA